jgi:uncharacterized membrane protein
MQTLSVLKFQTPYGAEQALQVLRGLQQQQLITVLDAATVSWEPGKKGPKTQQATNLAGAGALGGAFWGLLFGLLFFIPIFGLAIGAAFGALGGALTDVGIDDNFIKQVQQEVTPGTSALFLLSTGAVVDRVVPALRDLQPELISTNLSPEQEAQLREIFAGESATEEVEAEAPMAEAPAADDAMAEAPLADEAMAEAPMADDAAAGDAEAEKPAGE